MVHTNNGRTKRLGLLSKKEYDIIQILDQKEQLIKEREKLKKKKTIRKCDLNRIKEINALLNKSSKRHSYLVRRVPARLLQTKQDLQILLKSKSMASILQQNFSTIFKPVPEFDYDHYPIMASMEELSKIKFESVDNSKIIPDYSHWKVKVVPGKYGKRYWLDTDVEQETTGFDTTLPNYSIRGIKGTWYTNLYHISKETGDEIKKSEKIDVRTILIDALKIEERFKNFLEKMNLQIIPRDKVDAIKIREIKTNIERFYKTYVD